jgi:hypothetical protein
MPCVVTGVSAPVDNALAVVAWTVQKYVYLQPSRQDFHFTADAGTTWRSWQGDPALDGTAYEGAIKASVNLSTGAWSFSVPFTDTEVYFSGGAGPGTPALKWNIRDPNFATGEQVYTGPALAAIMSTDKTMQALLALASPNTWTVGGTTYFGTPEGKRRFVTVGFTPSSNTQAASWTDIGTAAWVATGSLRSTDDGVTAWRIVSGSESATGCTLELSGTLAATKTATINLIVEAP